MSGDSIVLAGDLGGTTCRLALVELQGAAPRILQRWSRPTGDVGGPAEAIRAFLEETGGRPARASLGVAGPVRAGRARFANVDWEVEEGELARAIGIPRTRLLNDFDALGHAIPALAADDLETLQEGRPDAAGTAALIGAGTGLGAGYVTREDGRRRVHSSEAGHLDFAPRSETEEALLRFLRRRHGHVSYERVVSGPGLVAVYRFLVETGRGAAEPVTRDRMEEGDAAAVISRHARDGSDPTCHRALELFVSAFGAHAGNLALAFQATAGVYVAGGIAPEILPRLREGPFLEAFRAKGRMRSLLESIPVRVIMAPDAGLIGAARASALPRPRERTTDLP